MQKITLFLWFDGQAEEAVNFYLSIFKNSKIVQTTRYDAASAMPSGQPAGSVMTIAFELDGQAFVALNGGPMFKFTPAISFVVNCPTQEEVDRYWEQLAVGGKHSQCGWLTDRYGMSWQIVPSVLGDLMNNADATKSQRVMQAVLKMTKLDIHVLRQVARG